MIVLLQHLLVLVLLLWTRFSLNMMQLEGYKPNQYASWLFRANKRLPLNLIGGTFVPLAFLPSPWALPIAGAVLLGVGLWLWLADKKRPAKKPLVLTGRIKRLMASHGVVLLALHTLFSWLLGLVGGAQPWAMSLALLGLCLPIIGILALIAVLPVEKLVADYYLRDAQRKLLADPNRIRIGITGSYGKTSTKVFLGTILSEKYRTFVTPQSYNTPMGVTRAIRESMPEDTQVFVGEMGARYTGDIKELCQLVLPQHGMITAIGPQHLETFQSQENINRTKFELIDSLPAGGLALFAADNGLCEALSTRAREPLGLYGIADGRQLARLMTAKDIAVGPWGSRFTLVAQDGQQITCQTKLLGMHNILNVVGCCAMAQHLGLTMQQIADGVAKLTPVEHRLALIDSGNGVIVIDDAFNSNPTGARAALDVLAGFEGKRIIITPGMVELGKIEQQENYKLGAYMPGRADVAILIGERRSHPIKQGALEAGFDPNGLYVVPSLDAAVALLAQVGGVGSVVLIENDLPDHYED